jgi:hypothetical protein
MSKTAQEIYDSAQDVIDESLFLVDNIEKTNNSKLKFVSKHAVAYLIEVVRQLSVTVLNLASTSASQERLLANRDKEISDLTREILSLRTKIVNENYEKEHNV